MKHPLPNHMHIQTPPSSRDSAACVRNGGKSEENETSHASTDINLCWNSDCAYNEAAGFSEVINQHEAGFEVCVRVVVVALASPSGPWQLKFSQYPQFLAG